MFRNNHGFTLIEMIGTLAIISILAAVLIPNLITRTEGVAVQGEVASMKSLTTTLEDYIIRTQSIPSGGLGATGNWSWALASQGALAQNRIINNELGRPRQFIIDPAFTLRMQALFNNQLTVAGVAVNEFTGAVPLGAPATTAASLYTQGATALGGGASIAPALNRTIPPFRVLMVSDLRKEGGAPIPNIAAAPGGGLAPLANGLTQAQFDAVWNQTATNIMPEMNPVGSLPIDGQRTGIVIQRISLGHLLHRVILTSWELNNRPSFQIETNIAPFPQVTPLYGTAAQIPPARIHEIFVFHRTRLALYQVNPNGANNPPVLQFVQIIKGDESFTYTITTPADPANAIPADLYDWVRG